jgi:hypothetical protein
MNEPLASKNELKNDAGRLRSNIRVFLKACGTEAACKCGATIWFIKTRNGRNAPWTGDLLNHFADCPAAMEFKI